MDDSFDNLASSESCLLGEQEYDNGLMPSKQGFGNSLNFNAPEDYNQEYDRRHLHIIISDEDRSKIDGDHSEDSNIGVFYHVYKRRWYILLQVSLLNFLQTAISGSWSPISVSATTAFGFSKHDYDLLADWGVIGLLVFLPLDMWLLFKFGLRAAIFSGCSCLFLGCGLRCLPLGAYQKYAIHVGQFLNGIAGCPVMAAAPFVSNTWFPFGERVLATGIMTVSGNIGGMFSFLVGPDLVQQTQNKTGANATVTHVIRHEIETYLLIQLGIALLLFLMMLTYFPNKPPSPPSNSAATKRLNFVMGIKALRKNVPYWSLVAMFCALIGSYYAWSGIMPVLYEDRNISQKTMGNIGTVTSVVGAVVGIILSWLADRLKYYRTAIWIGGTICIYLSCLYVVAMSLNWIQVPPFLFTKDGLWASVTILGVLVYAVQPLAYEMTSDAAYPVDEGVATYILAWLAILTNVVFFSTLSAIKDQNVAYYMLLGGMTTALPFLYFSVDQSNTRIQLDDT